jgi:thioester reductase-like protein
MIGQAHSPGSPFLQRIDRVALARGDAVAVQEPGRAVTYRQLLDRVEEEAARLRSGGFGPGSLRCIERPRSVDFVVEALACWRAGGAFLPLDPATPPPRRDAIRAEIAAHPPGEVAYVIYTSGSTGRPKGVKIGHGGLLPVLDAQITAFGLAPDKRALWCLSPGFDASLSDIGTALLSGATLCIPPPDLSPRALVDFLAAERITHADLPPSLLPLLGPLPSSLETLVIGGEVCPPDAVRFHARRLRVLSVYGPTEATICTSIAPCPPDTWNRPLLGPPLPHVRYRVEGARGNEVTEGEEGELLLGGVALALGYVAQPSLEAERFVEIEGARWYRTGDRVRRLPDNDLEFLGRIDRQLKLRGQLVAPEEIESCLRTHPAVIEVAVVPRQRPRSGRAPRPELLAFVVPRGGDRLDELRDHTRRHLPRPLCPRLIQVERLPRGASGKVDSAALLSQAEGAQGQRRRDLPEDVAFFCALFEEILGLDQVAPDEDFFTLGGDSLSGLELLAEAELRGRILPEDALYTSPPPTPHTLAGRGGSGNGMSTLGTSPPRPPSPWRAEGGAPAVRSPQPQPQSQSAAEGILLTGATGFLGAWLLATLLEREDRPIHALVRAPDRLSARRRLEAALAGLGKTLPEHRVEVWAGDAERERLGLAPGEWRDLGERVGTVVHGAARVHLMAPLEVLRGPNVEATRQVARLLDEGPPKALLHVSTLSVFVATDHPASLLDEATDPGDISEVFGGYARSKRQAEELLRGRPHAVIRPGLLTGDTGSGQGSPSCQLAQVLRGLGALGCVPRGDHEAPRVDVTPVDHAARSIAALIGQRVREGVFHVASRRGATLAQLVEALRTEGFRCDEVSPEEFLERARGSDHPAIPVTVLSLGRLLGVERRATDLFLMTGRELRCERTEVWTGERAPEVDGALLRRYVRACMPSR